MKFKHCLLVISMSALEVQGQQYGIYTGKNEKEMLGCLLHYKSSIDKLDMLPDACTKLPPLSPFEMQWPKYIELLDHLDEYWENKKKESAVQETTVATTEKLSYTPKDPICSLVRCKKRERPRKLALKK